MSATETHETFDLAPVGSRFYLDGVHVTVIETGLLDSSYEPAVRLHRDGDAKPMRIPCPLHHLLRRGVRTDES